MTFLRSLLPRSMPAQITLIAAVSVMLGVILVVGIVFVFFEESPRHKPPAIAARIASISLLVQNASSQPEAEAIVSSARKSGFRVDLVAESELMAVSEVQPQFAVRLLSEQLEATWGVDVVQEAALPGGVRDKLAVKAGTHGVLIFDITSESRLWHYVLPPVVLTLAIVLVFVTLLSIYAIRWLIAPLRALADAANSFGRSPDSLHSVKLGGPREIARVADALDDMRGRIRTLIDDRTRMLTAISHDLNTPLTRLGLRAERIADSELRDGILHEVRQVTRMLDETLHYLRDDLSPEEMSRIDLPSLLQTICTEFSDVGHSVSYEGPARKTWICRSGVLTRALSNIVDNAVKHGSIVTVSLRTLADDSVEIDVADDGPGIPASMQEHVFTPFVKADDARNPVKRSGFGLGLSIARDAIRGHGGDIALLDRQPQGLVVRLSFPCRPPGA